MQGTIAGKPVAVLIDTGCTECLVGAQVLRSLPAKMRYTRNSRDIFTAAGSCIKSTSEVVLSLQLGGQRREVTCLILPQLLCDVQLILGVAGIRAFGGLTVAADGRFRLGTVRSSLLPKRHDECKIVTRSPAVVDAVATATDIVEDESRAVAECGNAAPEATLQVIDDDFAAVFDGRCWTVEWKWSGRPPDPSPAPAHYSINEGDRAAFDTELQQWIANGWLQPAPLGTKPTLPLMAVKQEHKGAVRPVMDFRRLNEHVSCHSGDADACTEKLRSWGRMW